MAAAAEEGRKRLRGMPGLDLVETPKRLERQIRTEVEARVPEAVRQTQTSKVFAKPEVYDRTVTPSGISDLGEAASVARLRGAMANLAYNQNKLRQLADEPLTTTGGAALFRALCGNSCQPVSGFFLICLGHDLADGFELVDMAKQPGFQNHVC